MDPAASSQFQFVPVSLQSLFQAHTTVVICGVNHIVHRFLASTSFPSFEEAFVDVPVFAATFLQERER